MPLDNETMALLIAMQSDEKKGARLAEIHAAMAELDQAREKLEATRQANQQEIAAAAQLKADAEATGQHAAARAAELDAREAKMAEVQQAIQAEHQKWETEVRQPTDAVHIERGKDLAARETAMTFREKEVAESAAKLREDQTNAASLTERYGTMIAELLAVLEKQGVLPGEGLDPAG